MNQYLISILFYSCLMCLSLIFILFTIITVVSVEEKKVVFATKPLLATGVDIEYMIWGPSGEPQV